MKKILLFIFVQILLVFCFLGNLFGSEMYVDHTLGDDITNGSYSISQRNDSGSDGNAYRKIQDAINVANPGDTIYMRGGEYNEHIIMPAGKQGDNDHWFTLTSYNGEWAKIDGKYAGGSMFSFSSGSYDICPAYWKFLRFEVTGAGEQPNGTSAGSGFVFDTARYITFEYLYIHDNYTDSGSAGLSGGIAIQNDAGAGQHIAIRYCYLKNNGLETNANSVNIGFYTDYKYNPDNVDIDRAMSYNEIAYNLIEGGYYGIKHKVSQWLSLNHLGTDITYKDKGDKIHHNILVGQKGHAMRLMQDFVQCYNNIINSNGDVLAMNIGDGFDNTREPFYATIYNNLFIKTILNILHDDSNSTLNSSYTEKSPFVFTHGTSDLHPHCYIYNNIFQSIGEEYGGYNDLNVIWDGQSRWTINQINMNTIEIENNLFVPKGPLDEIINVGNNIINDFSENTYEGVYSSTIYTNPSLSNLFLGDNIYKTNGSYVLQGSATIANGGIGGNHPYLSTTLPMYIGPTNPNKTDSGLSWTPGISDPDDAGWVDYVLHIVGSPNKIRNVLVRKK